MYRYSFLLLLILGLLFTSCNKHAGGAAHTPKFQPGDPFEKTIAESQFFKLSAKEEKVLEARGGTRIVVPLNAFLREDGSPYEGEVTIELAEALTLADMIGSNLTTTSGGKPLETGGMIYFAAKGDGEEIHINPDNPIYVEVPTNERKPGMMVYDGIRDKDGNMDWVDPRPLETFLVPVDFALLDFLPQGFEAEVIGSMPFRSHTNASPELVDSLFYSLEGFEQRQWDYLSDSLIALYKVTQAFINGTSISEATPAAATSASDSAGPPCRCGIHPARVKAIKSPEFANTFLATREFEWRMQSIYKSCDNAVLELYTSNLDKNLWEVDEMAAKQGAGTGSEKQFTDHAALKQTRVKDGEKYGKQLSALYNERLTDIRKQLEALALEAQALADADRARMEALRAEYKELVIRRETFSYLT